MTLSKKQRDLEKIKADFLKRTDLPLYADRLQNSALAVFGEGDSNASILFIGEAPGKNEAQIGRPFCGRAGTILDEALQSIDLNRSDIYITNIVKDRPPHNRDPLPQEIESYGHILTQEILVIQPKVLIPLGRFAMSYVMNMFNLGSHIEPISKIHGKKYTAQTPYGEAVVIPFYHPAATIYNQHLRQVFTEDFKRIKRLNKKS